jgi:hypothetical protein
MTTNDPMAQLRNVLESGKSIKFGRGVIGKTSHIAMTNLGVWGIVVLRWNENLLVDAGLLVTGLAATAFSVWWTKASQAFAERNPAQAMLDGADFIEYRRLEMQAKGGTEGSSMTPVEIAPSSVTSSLPEQKA